MNRKILKATLLRKRRKLIPALGYVPFCDGCGKAINNRRPADVHEFLVTRGDLPKSTGRQHLIFVEENCALLHHSPCHMELGASKQMRNRLAMIFVDRYGPDRMKHFIHTLELTPGYAKQFYQVIDNATEDINVGYS